MDLSKLASSVLEEYGIEPENISVVQSANIKTVWRIKTKDRETVSQKIETSIRQSSLFRKRPGILYTIMAEMSRE